MAKCSIRPLHWKFFVFNAIISTMLGLELYSSFLQQLSLESFPFMQGGAFLRPLDLNLHPLANVSGIDCLGTWDCNIKTCEIMQNNSATYVAYSSLADSHDCSFPSNALYVITNISQELADQRKYRNDSRLVDQQIHIGYYITTYEIFNALLWTGVGNALFGIIVLVLNRLCPSHCIYKIAYLVYGLSLLGVKLCLALICGFTIEAGEGTDAPESTKHWEKVARYFIIGSICVDIGFSVCEVFSINKKQYAEEKESLLNSSI